LSTIVALIGPIEYWWNTDDDPQRFNSLTAVNYREHRDDLGKYLVAMGCLVYRPHEAFKGEWDDRAQVLNDVMVQIADVVVCMRPYGIPGKGTDHELELAEKSGKPIVYASPGRIFSAVMDDVRAKTQG
jgi:hypothetical protein